MRQLVAVLVGTVAASGCSILYNPDNIHVKDAPFHDAPVDVIPDANPRDLTLASVYPPKVFEGTGQFNSLPAIFELDGTNITNNATVTFSSSDVTLVTSAVSSDHSTLIAEVAIAIDSTCPTGSAKDIAVIVSEPNGAGGSAVATLGSGSGSGFSITCLDELMTNTVAAASAQYSEIAISTGGLTVSAGSGSALLWSASKIDIPGNIDVSGIGSSAGPGGGSGGGSGGNGSGLSYGRGGASSVLGGCAGGGGGGFANNGAPGTTSSLVTGETPGSGGPETGDVWVSSYAANSSSGGGGGSACSAGVGGGGGGTIELTAQGDLSVGNISANGSAGSANGGAGTGGVIVLRNGAGTMSIGALSATAGQLISGSYGGASSPGRIRVDSASGTQPTNAAPAAVIGPMFDGLTSTKIIVTSYPKLLLYGTPGDSSSMVKVFDKTGSVVGGTYTANFGNTTPATAMVGPVTLANGWNQVCVVVPGGSASGLHPVGENCIVLGYVP